MDRKKMIQQFTDVGLPLEHAEVVVDCFETSDLYGVKTHGTLMINKHLEKIITGGYNLEPDFNITNETPAFCVIDGQNGMGPVVADYCMNYAMKKAKEVGIFTVLSNNNNTLGPAFYYPLKAAEQGLIGLVCSNSPAQMAPFGGIDKMLGTNPFAAVIPVPNSDPIIIDMATSVVAKSKFLEYKQKNMQLPEGWALNSKGEPTTDPMEAIEGLILPMAGFKGYSIAMLIDILSGVLSGAAFLNKVGRFYSSENKCMNVGFYMVAIDPYIVLGDSYKNLISEFVDVLKNSTPFKDMVVSIPGEDRIQHKRRSEIKHEKNNDF